VSGGGGEDDKMAGPAWPACRCARSRPKHARNIPYALRGGGGRRGDGGARPLVFCLALVRGGARSAHMNRRMCVRVRVVRTPSSSPSRTLSLSLSLVRIDSGGSVQSSELKKQLHISWRCLRGPSPSPPLLD
jgi:hypothetical protein